MDIAELRDSQLAQIEEARAQAHATVDAVFDRQVVMLNVQLQLIAADLAGHPIRN